MEFTGDLIQDPDGSDFFNIAFDQGLRRIAADANAPMAGLGATAYNPGP